MRKLTAPRLEVISDRWVNGRRRIVKEGAPFLISIDFIRENLYYQQHYEWYYLSDSSEDIRYTYMNLLDDIKENGWNIEYPASIIIGPIGEVYYGNGNHRLNIVMNYIPELKEIPVCINYLTYSPYNIDITYRRMNYGQLVGCAEYTDMYDYISTAKFPKWRNKSNEKV